MNISLCSSENSVKIVHFFNYIPEQRDNVNPISPREDASRKNASPYFNIVNILIPLVK